MGIYKIASIPKEVAAYLKLASTQNIVYEELHNTFCR